VAERRTPAEIRQEMAAAREQLGAALADLRQSVGQKRKRAGTAGGAAAAGLAAVTTLRIVRRLRRRGRGG
jgi:hypothetical protein